MTPPLMISSLNELLHVNATKNSAIACFSVWQTTPAGQPQLNKVAWHASAWHGSHIEQRPNALS
eukprot:13607847-Alexandrium_andersonii.AAC.1